ncbi:hypothetical protein H4R33_002655 [Dimargaris cristalligena]|nr:hypothetical protein H4R33_002655 [Dimargaris cristalligena]
MEMTYRMLEQFFSVKFYNSAAEPKPLTLGDLEKLCLTSSSPSHGTPSEGKQLNCALVEISKRGGTYQVEDYFRRHVRTANIVQMRHFLSPYFESAFRRYYQVVPTVPNLFGNDDGSSLGLDYDYDERDQFDAHPLLSALKNGGLVQVQNIWLALDDLLNRKSRSITPAQLQLLYERPSLYFRPTGQQQLIAGNNAPMVDGQPSPPPLAAGRTNQVSLDFLRAVWQRTQKHIIQCALELDLADAVEEFADLLEESYGILEPFRLRLIVRAFELNRTRTQALALQYWRDLSPDRRALLELCAEVKNYRTTWTRLRSEAQTWGSKLASRAMGLLYTTPPAVPRSFGQAEHQRCDALFNPPSIASSAQRS